MSPILRGVLVCGVFLLSGNACQQTGEPKYSLLVGAAVSLQPVLDSVIARYAALTNAPTVIVSYAGSGTIRRQLEFGAPIDIFLSAAPEHIDSLLVLGLVDPSSREFVVSNGLVLISSSRRPPLSSMQDLRLPGISRIAIGQPDIVPAGRYAYESLDRSGLLQDLDSKIVFTKDVQQVLVYVQTGSADAGFVYGSDVRSSMPVRVFGAVPDSLHHPIRYEGIISMRSRHAADARRFLLYLRSDSIRSLFIARGFRPPGSQ